MSKMSCGVNVWEVPGNAVISRDIANLRKKMCDKFFEWNCQTFSFFGRNRCLSEELNVVEEIRYNGSLQSVTGNARE